MAIVNFTTKRRTKDSPENPAPPKDVPENAHALKYFPFYQRPYTGKNYKGEIEDFPGVDVWTWQTHCGLCLRERERNMHDDSDFFMLVWNEATESAEEIMFATTRGWTYPALGSAVDASPEIVAKFEAWQRKRQRSEKLRQLTLWRETRRQLANDAGLTMHEFLSLVRVFGRSEKLMQICRLLASEHKNRLRSSFRKSLAKQIRDWFRNPIYSTPLSARQLEYLR